MGFTEKFSGNLKWRKCNTGRRTSLLVSRVNQKESDLMKFLGNKGRFLSIYIISLSIISPGDAQGSRNIIVS